MTDAQDTSPEGQRPLVYIREVAVAALPADVQEQAQGIETLYAIGGENGERIALVRDRRMAFMVARQNDLTPLSVH